jgi:RHS repeat-associated protein
VPAGTVLWVNATTNATISVFGTYSDPVHRGLSAGATYIAVPGLEAWSPTLPPAQAFWSYIRHSPFAIRPSSDPWQARLTGDLSPVNELPRVFAPGQALYVVNQVPVELEAPDPALRIRYYHQDHLGSSSVITDAEGALIEETAFYPFGTPRHEHRLLPIEESYRFTQKERDQESGLHYFEARYLTGPLARFLSVDPMYANTESSTDDPQALNLYAYVRNNPLQYTDPTGLDRNSEIADAAALADTRAAKDSALVTQVLGFDPDEIDWDQAKQALQSTWVGQAIKAPPPITATDAASFSACFGDTITFGGTRLLREGLGIAPTVVDKNSGACTAGTVAGVLAPLPGPKGVPRGGPGIVVQWSNKSSARALVAAPNRATSPSGFGDVPTRVQKTPLTGGSEPTSVRGWHPRQIRREDVRSGIAGGNAVKGEIAIELINVAARLLP